MDACDVLVENGCCRNLVGLEKVDVPHLVETASLGCTILKIKAELDQFIFGLDEAGVLHTIQKYPDLFKSMFVASDDKPLTAGKCQKSVQTCAFEIYSNRCNIGFTGKKDFF